MDASAEWRPGWILQPGQLLVDNYRVVGMAGAPGGMGQVFVAEDLSLGLRVAIKVPALNILLAPKGPERFLREARIAARLGPHENIVQIRACLTDPDLRLPDTTTKIPFIVMEYLAGGDLAQQLADGPLPLADVLSHFAAICAGVHYAHSHGENDGGGIVHRDLKPQNICFDDRARLVVVDFGLARVLEDPSSSGGLNGTPAYMAPEQWRPGTPIDARTDVYALGVLLFELVTGRTPFAGESLEDVMNGHMFRPPPDPSSFRPALPAHVSRAVLTALGKRKDDRFETVDALARAVASGPSSPVATSVRDHRVAGDALARRNEFGPAIEQYDAAIRRDPRDVLAFVNRGYCLYRLGRHHEAIEEYTRALGIDPGHTEALNNRGMAWKDLGDYARAIEDFEAAMRADPTHPLAPNNLRDAKRLRRS